MPGACEAISLKASRSNDTLYSLRFPRLAVRPVDDDGERLPRRRCGARHARGKACLCAGQAMCGMVGCQRPETKRPGT